MAVRVTREAIEVLNAPSLPAVRLTREAIEVLNVPDLPAVRVTRQAIEVLGSEVGIVLPSVKIVVLG